MKRINEREVIVGPVRLSYLNVFTPKVNDLKDGAKEFSAVLLFPKENCAEQPKAVEEVNELRAALKAAVFAKWGDKPPAKLRNPIRDGDEETDSQGEPKAPGYWFMNVSAKEMYPPLLVDGTRQEVRGGWNSGDWGNVQVSIFAYDQKGNRGVSAGLRAIQFTHKGEAIGSGGAPTPDVFDVVAGAAPSTAKAPDEYDPFADE